MAVLRGVQLLLAFAAGGAFADHLCSDEVASACPDRPAADVGTCLKDPNEHDATTEISSGCTDFMALNKACGEDIEKKCDGAFFSDDTIPCLTQWTEKEDLTSRCQGVLSWAVPQDEVEEEEVTDELGMTEEEVKEKEEWRAKRKAARTEAIDRMKMKDVDRKNEEDRIALEEFKKADPEAYQQMIEQQEEEKKQKAAFAKMERARQAAIERKRRQEAGLDDEDDTPKKEQKSSGSGKGKKKGGSWMYSLLSLGVVGLVIYGIYYLVVSPPSGGGKRSGGGSGKKGKKGR